MVLVFSGVASAQSLATSARQLEPGTWKLIPYYQGTYRQSLKFTSVSGGGCAGGGAFNPAFNCASSGEVKVHGSGGLGMVKLLAQPWDRMQYYVAGGLGGMSLRIPGNAVATSRRTGWAWAGGARALLAPDTVVSPAITLDLSYGRQGYSFDAIGPTVIDHRLDMEQLQAALELSHRFEVSDSKFSFEPYGGVKWLRTHSWLTDTKTGGQSGGIQHTYSPFLGLQFPVFERESLFAEASFVNGVQYAAGAHIRFK